MCMDTKMGMYTYLARVVAQLSQQGRRQVKLLTIKHLFSQVSGFNVSSQTLELLFQPLGHLEDILSTTEDSAAWLASSSFMGWFVTIM